MTVPNTGGVSSTGPTPSALDALNQVDTTTTTTAVADPVQAAVVAEQAAIKASLKTGMRNVGNLAGGNKI